MPGIIALKFSELSQAPVGPGIYAWYVTLPVGPADLIRDIMPGTGVDRGEQQLRDVLARHSQKHVPPPLNVTAQAAFQSVFAGTLKSTLNKTFADELEPSGDASGQTEEGYDAVGRQDLKFVLKQQRTRKALVDLLGAATPYLTAPIYIGTSGRLRTRLAQHADELERLWDALGKDPSLRDRMDQIVQSKKSTFAVRAIALGFSPDQLTVQILDAREVLEGDFSEDQLKMLATASEWLLNRWHRPIAGRL